VARSGHRRVWPGWDHHRGLGPPTPAIKSDLGIGTGVIGLLLAGVTIGSIVGLLASTPLIHWFGNRRSLTGALLVIAAALAIIGVAISLKSVPLLSVAFVGIGAGIGTLDVLINVEGAAIEEAAARTLMPQMHAAWSIGVALGSGLVPLAPRSGSHRRRSSSARPSSSGRWRLPSLRRFLVRPTLAVRWPRQRGP